MNATAKTHAADLRFHLRNAEQAAFRAEAEAPTRETHDQARQLREGLETIADLVSDTVSMTAHIEQTHSETGGTHTYVRTGGGLWHVAAKSGRAVELEQ